MRRRIHRSDQGLASIDNISLNNAVFHVRTHHDRELSRLSKGTKEPSSQLQGQITNARIPQDTRQFRNDAFSIDSSSAMAKRRTRKEVGLGVFYPKQSTALVPARPQIRSANNVRFHVTEGNKCDEKRFTKIAAALAGGVALQRHEGTVKLTRNKFQTPTIREIGSNEDLCDLTNVQAVAKRETSSSPRNKCLDALWGQARSSRHNGSQTTWSSPPMQETRMSNYHNSSGCQKQLPKMRGSIRKRRRKHLEDETATCFPIFQESISPSPQETLPSPRENSISLSSSDQKSDDSLSKSNESSSNLYGSRAHSKYEERKDRQFCGPSILKTPTSRSMPSEAAIDVPIFASDNSHFQSYQNLRNMPPFPPPAVPRCATCQFVLCSTCRRPVCAVCSSQKCTSCSAPLCSTCSVASCSAYTCLLCVSCYNSLCNSLCSRPQSYPTISYSRIPCAVSASPPCDPSSPCFPSYGLHQPPPRDPSSPCFPSYNLNQPPPCELIPPHCPPYAVTPPPACTPTSPYYSTVSPCSPYIDWLARCNLPPMIPNNVCETGLCEPCYPSHPYDNGPHEECTIPKSTRRNSFLDLFSRGQLDPSQTCSSCCPLRTQAGTQGSLMYPTDWLNCALHRPINRQRAPPYVTAFTDLDNDCTSTALTLLNVVWIVVPVLIFYVLAFLALSRLIAINKFTRLAAVVANTALLYIIVLEPDDLIVYPTDKPKVRKAPLPASSQMSCAPCDLTT